MKRNRKFTATLHYGAAKVAVKSFDRSIVTVKDFMQALMRKVAINR